MSVKENILSIQLVYNDELYLLNFDFGWNHINMSMFAFDKAPYYLQLMKYTHI